MIEVIIDSIRVSLISQQRIVMLRDANSDQQLPIWIGPCEADAIGIVLQETVYARPLTHDLLKMAIEELGATVSHIIIDDLQGNVFRATLHLDLGNDQAKEIDCRPSDAIAIAVRAKVPIYVADDVMKNAGITPEPAILDDGSEDADGATSDSDVNVSGEEGLDLDAFKDFLSNLDDE